MGTIDSGILPSGLRPSLRLPKIAPGNFVERARGSGWANQFNKKATYKVAFLLNMARPARFERATAWFVARYSIQLSYGRLILMAEREGFEPSIRVNVYTLSRGAPSATRPPLHNNGAYSTRPS